MSYNLEKALKTAAKVGVLGIGATLYGGAIDNEAVQYIGYTFIAGSIAGAAIAGLYKLLD